MSKVDSICSYNVGDEWDDETECTGTVSSVVRACDTDVHITSEQNWWIGFSQNS